jgi:hypothetical protein
VNNIPPNQELLYRNLVLYLTQDEYTFMPQNFKLALLIDEFLMGFGNYLSKMSFIC